jgi:predicted dehydrogenase
MRTIRVAIPESLTRVPFAQEHPEFNVVGVLGPSATGLRLPSRSEIEADDHLLASVDAVITDDPNGDLGRIVEAGRTVLCLGYPIDPDRCRELHRRAEENGVRIFYGLPTLQPLAVQALDLIRTVTGEPTEVVARWWQQGLPASGVLRARGVELLAVIQRLVPFGELRGASAWGAESNLRISRGAVDAALAVEFMFEPGVLLNLSLVAFPETIPPLPEAEDSGRQDRLSIVVEGPTGGILISGSLDGGTGGILVRHGPSRDDGVAQARPYPAVLLGLLESFWGVFDAFAYACSSDLSDPPLTLIRPAEIDGAHALIASFAEHPSVRVMPDA